MDKIHHREVSRVVELSFFSMLQNMFSKCSVIVSNSSFNMIKLLVVYCDRLTADMILDGACLMEHKKFLNIFSK